MPFKRVRDRVTKHEYDAPVGVIDADPDLYDVIDDEPVDWPREATYYSPKRRGKSVGDSNEGEG